MTDVLTELDDGLLRLTMNRPARKNALTRTMYAALAEALCGAAEDAAVRCVLIRGVDGVFTAGNDLGDFLKDPPQSKDEPVFDFMYALADFPKPVVAQVEGPAVGIGTTMLLHCDLVYAAHDATFRMPFVDLGVVPEAGSSLLVPRLAGHALAAELLLLAGPFDAEKALRAGLVTASVPASEVAAAAEKAARKLVAKPLAALVASKRLMKEPLRDAVRQAMDAEVEVFVDRLTSPEAKEAFSAFFEKRKPDFRQFG